MENIKMEIARLLLDGVDNVRKDKAIFNAWEERRITTPMALKEFKENNNIKCHIEPSDFVYWLGTLGYRQLL